MAVIKVLRPAGTKTDASDRKRMMFVCVIVLALGIGLYLFFPGPSLGRRASFYFC